jgi:hypothetical protein
MIILFGIFIRTNDPLASLSLGSMDSGLFFIAGNSIIYSAYAFLYVKHRSIDWTALTNFLFIVMITLQINTLYYYFWSYAFDHNFHATTPLSSDALINGLESALTVVVTSSLFLTKLSQVSLFALVML